jgi:GT2 family glycosyltransferase
MTPDTKKNSPLPRYKPSEPISVILVCRNKSACLPRVIAALARNTRRPDKVILSDDASTDHSPEIFSQLCQEHRVDHQVMLHPTAAKEPLLRVNTLRNTGVHACPEGLTIILDADHEVARTHIEAHWQLHTSHSEAIISTGPRLEYANPDSTGPINFMWGHEPFSMLQTSSTESVPSWAGVLASNMAMPKAAIIELGGFDTAYDGHYGFEDIDFMYRAWQVGYRFKASFEAHVIHVPHITPHKRRGKRNRKRFTQKYGFSPTYPIMQELLTRKCWSEYYQELLARASSIHKTMRSTSYSAAQLIALENVGGKLLIQALARRLLKRLRALRQWLISVL